MSTHGLEERGLVPISPILEVLTAMCTADKYPRFNLDTIIIILQLTPSV